MLAVSVLSTWSFLALMKHASTHCKTASKIRACFPRQPKQALHESKRFMKCVREGHGHSHSLAPPEGPFAQKILQEHLWGRGNAYNLEAPTHKMHLKDVCHTQSSVPTYALTRKSCRPCPIKNGQHCLGTHMTVVFGSKPSLTRKDKASCIMVLLYFSF